MAVTPGARLSNHCAVQTGRNVQSVDSVAYRTPCGQFHIHLQYTGRQAGAGGGRIARWQSDRPSFTPSGQIQILLVCGTLPALPEMQRLVLAFAQGTAE